MSGLGETWDLVRCRNRVKFPQFSWLDLVLGYYHGSGFGDGQALVRIRGLVSLESGVSFRG